MPRRFGRSTLRLMTATGQRIFLLRRASSTCSRCSASAKCRSASAAILPSPAASSTQCVPSGAVSDALARLGPGDPVGLRGPFGAGWPMTEAAGRDVVIVAGGLGLAPLRPALYQLFAGRARYGKIVLLYGARSPDDILFRREIESWRRRLDIEIEVTVDHASSVWHGHVGVVTTLISRADFDPLHAIALVCGPEVMMRFAITALRHSGLDDQIHLSLYGAQHEVRNRVLRSLPIRTGLRVPRWAGVPSRPGTELAGSEGDLTWPPRIASLGLPSGSSPPATAVSSACLTARTSCSRSPALSTLPTSLRLPRGAVRGRYDLSLVEGSVTTASDAARIQDVRARSRTLVTIGACATAGGIQALRNWADVKEYASVVYARPDYIQTLATSTAIADHVAVDFELRGCPISKRQLLEVISAMLAGRRPVTPPHSVCIECKLKGKRLRDGGAWNTMSWPGHSCGVWRNLPVLQPRMLRLLWTDGNAEHALAQRWPAQARHGGAGANASLSNLQRQRRTVSRGKRPP